MARFKEKYPEKYAAKSAMGKIKPSVDGNQFHHWSYNLCDAKDVIELTVRQHKKAHRFIIYDQERFMYRRSTDNVLLDTKQEHLKWITYAINNFED